MPVSLLCAIHLDGPLPEDQAAARLARGLPVLERHGLAPLDFDLPAWRDGAPELFGGTSLFHAGFAADTGNELWGAGFMHVPAPQARASVVTMFTPAAPLGRPG